MCIRDRIKDELAQLVYRNVEPVTDIRARYGKLDRAGDAPWIRDGFVPFPNGGVWAEAFSQTYCLFSLEVAVSPGQEGRPLVLEIRTNRSGWNAVNPQMLAFVDGEPFQGLDTNHTDVYKRQTATCAFPRNASRSRKSTFVLCGTRASISPCGNTTSFRPGRIT